MKYAVMFVCLAALAASAFAGPTCVPSNRVVTENYPGERAINPSNNLLLPAGKAVAAQGQKITITGKVLDKNCAPVANAVVELWQQNPYGRWILASDADLAGAEPTFAGAGRTYTNNEGEFTFFTAFPAPGAHSERKGKKTISWRRAPFVNIKITRRGLSDFTTALFFAGDERNDADVVFKKLSAKARTDASLVVTPNDAGELVGKVEIVLPVVAPYRVY
jgi:protocatechuate 3,4-dioxygenase beta subunit